MGLFVKQQRPSPTASLYTVGLSKTVIIVGLGNPGKEYELTRHNAGFLCVDFFAGEHGFPAWTVKKDLKCQISQQNLGDTRVILVKPTTFMNLSGEAVHAIQHFYKVAPSSTLVVHDELDIPFGQLRTRIGGGAAGHNGIKSLLQHGNDNALRLRIGIHNTIAEQADSADFVLGKFTKDEQAQLPTMQREVNDLITDYIFSGQLTLQTRSFEVQA